MNYTRQGDTLSLVIDDAHQGMSVREFFQSYRLSRKRIHLLVMDKDYSVNGTFAAPETILNKGDVLRVKAYDPDDGMYTPGETLPDVVYEDDILLAAYKPAGLPVYPSSQDITDSLAHRVALHYAVNGDNIPVRYIHRLDDDTEGLVLFVKCAFVQSLMDRMLEEREIHRDYLAIVHGRFPDRKSHVIDAPLGRDRHQSGRMRVGGSQRAVTTYTCLDEKDNLSLVSCSLETGRRHQIRVHMASLSHPLVGDKLYGARENVPLALQAWRLSFIHPLSNGPIKVCVQEERRLSL